MQLSHRAHLSQLDGRRVEVDAVALVDGEVGLGLLQLELVLVWIDGLAKFVLASLEVASCHLVDGFIKEGTAPKGGLTDCQPQDLVRGDPRVLFPVGVESVADCELGQNLWGVVAGRSLAVATRQPEDEVALVVNDAALLPIRARFFEEYRVVDTRRLGGLESPMTRYPDHRRCRSHRAHLWQGNPYRP